MSTSKTITYTLPLGWLFGAILSWKLNHSILWLILHAIFGWFYVMYAIIFRV